MDLAYHLNQLARLSEKGIVSFVNFSDPITVSITLFILLSPVALIYMAFTRMGMTKLMQMEIKGKNILYVIAHPDDEAM